MAAKPGVRRWRITRTLQRRWFLAAVILALAPSLQTLRAQSTPACREDPSFQLFDFWLGDWQVFTGDTLAGTNRITRILDGCTVTEEWQDADGGPGLSLFYYSPATHLWKQGWVTDQAARAGGLKEKHLIARLTGGGIRFQGEIALPDGRLLLDRTTLAAEPNGEVRQVIEVSRDGGDTWRTTFDARYRHTR